MNHNEPQKMTKEEAVRQMQMMQYTRDCVAYCVKLAEYYRLESSGLLDADARKPAPPEFGLPF